MHEFSVASEIWESVMSAARQHGAVRVKSIRLEVGALNLIEEDQLRFWLEALAERDGSAGLEVHIVTLQPRARCTACGAVAPPPSRCSPRPACPCCGAAQIALEGGRELRVVSAEVEVGSAGAT